MIKNNVRYLMKLLSSKTTEKADLDSAAVFVLQLLQDVFLQLQLSALFNHLWLQGQISHDLFTVGDTGDPSLSVGLK